MTIHLVFDLAATFCALAVTVVVYRWRLEGSMQRIEQAGIPYAVALVAGAAVGGYAAGTLNLWLSGTPAIARSVVGALAGSILAIEVFKARKGIRGSTGLIFVAGLATSIAVGRWGCYFSGLDDHTYGTPTGLPWGHDFGDGVMRHPVQLYESFAMAGFLVYTLIMLARRNPYFMRNGFYLLILFYASQRFVWEFLKPYAPLAGPFNLFHFICIALVCYSLIMMMGPVNERARA